MPLLVRAMALRPDVRERGAARLRLPPQRRLRVPGHAPLGAWVAATLPRAGYDAKTKTFFVTAGLQRNLVCIVAQCVWLRV